jgi:hypothetical protein
MVIFNTKKLKSFFDKSKIVVLLIWILVNCLLLLKNGIVATGETEKYIDEAHLFLQTGKLGSSNYWLYSTQIFLLAFCIKFRLGLAFAIAVQFVFNLIATLCFYRILQLIFINKNLVIIGTAFLLFNQPYQEFNTFLQTESLFYSLTLIYGWYLLHLEKLSVKNLVVTTLGLTILIVTRPTGLLFLPPTFIYLFFIYYRKMGVLSKLGVLVLLSFLFLFILDKAMGSGGRLDFMLPFKNENIICGVPTLRGFIPIKTTENPNSIYGLFYYVFHNFGQFARLASLRTVAFFGIYRNYYSTLHNSFLIIFFYSIHAMALGSILYWIRVQIAKFAYFLSIIILTWLSVILTCDDWHNRFYLSISPYIIILSMGFVSRFFKKNAKE